MTNEELRAAHAEMLRMVHERSGLAPITTASLTHTTQTFGDPAQVWQAFCEAGPRQGWVQWQSRQEAFEDGPPEASADAGTVLAAEAVTAIGEGLRLHLDDGQWTLWCYRHDPQGDDCLCDEVCHLLHGTTDRWLRYRRYWRLDDVQGTVPIAAVLCGTGTRED